MRMAESLTTSHTAIPAWSILSQTASSKSSCRNPTTKSGKPNPISELRGPRRAERLRYRRFVEEGLSREVENPFEAVQWQAVLGDESFVQKLRDRKSVV